MRQLLALPLLMLMPLLACGDSSAATRVYLTVAAQPLVKARANQMTIRISSLVNGVATTVRDDTAVPASAQFPYVIELSPLDDDATRTYRVEASALQNGAVIASAKLSSGYVEHKIRYVTLTLEDSCLEVSSCSTEQTCHLGGCVPAQIAPGSLPIEPEPDVQIDAGVSDAGGSTVVSDGGGSTVVSDGGGSTVVPRDAAVVVPPVPDAGVVPVGTDAGGDDSPCSGKYTGLYHGTVIPDQIELTKECEFSYSASTACQSSGTYLLKGGDSGELILTVEKATDGIYFDANGIAYGCLGAGLYMCKYAFTDSSLTYSCAEQQPMTYVR